MQILSKTRSGHKYKSNKNKSLEHVNFLFELDFAHSRVNLNFR
jgi:hypothetical protein